MVGTFHGVKVEIVEPGTKVERAGETITVDDETCASFEGTIWMTRTVWNALRVRVRAEAASNG